MGPNVQRRVFANCGGFVSPSSMVSAVHKMWKDEGGQDISEYAVMLALILLLVMGTIKLVGSNANNAFSSVASSLQ